ncbi:MAG: hypothetical protein ACREFI_10585 [Stellaceae bacterium]
MRYGASIRVAAGLLLALSACASVDDRSTNNLLSSFSTPNPAPGNFFACYGYGCKYRAHIALTQEEWREVQGEFSPAPDDASAERTQVAAAVARFERLVGQRTGTLVHQQDSRMNFGDPTQLDCVDDSVNTWTYLTMLAHAGVLRYHRVAGLAHRGTLLTLDFSNTAVLVEKENGERFAVDPWLGEAGVPPPVVPLELWFRSG